MDPALKEFLEKMKTSIQDMITAERTASVERHDVLVKKLEEQAIKTDELVQWKPNLEIRISKLQEAVTELQLARPTAAASAGGAAAADLTTALLNPLNGPSGHRVDTLPGGSPSVVAQTPAAPPVTGMINFQSPMGPVPVDSSSTSLVASQLLSNLGQAAPTILFPTFTGENPNLWKTQAEQYFAMFNIHESYWVPMAILNFTGSAGIWLQSVHRKLGGFDWISFTSLICTRFGRDRHQLLIRQFYAIKQTSTVADYIERFEVIMNHLISYSEDTHPYYFLTRFVEGLRADIRAVVLVQRPPDLDTACSLALLQEEVAEGEIIPAQQHQQFRLAPSPYRQAQMTPSSFQSRPATPHISEDRHGVDASHASSDISKIAALRNFRRARGLCFKCGEKWGKEHTCPAQVQMHVVEELLAMFSSKEVMGESDAMFTPPTSPETLCALSLQAISGTDAPTVVQIHAWIQGKECLLLVDSCSTTSFVSVQLAS
uniref:Uncharacterized protein n=1 Tax=Avena sativa TaxID=4498 RepID=A0ACD5V1P2_AVESA